MKRQTTCVRVIVRFWTFLGLLCLSLAWAQTYTVSTLAGSATPPLRSIDATGAAAQFYRPMGVSVSGDGTTYVADTYNHTIRKVTSGGVVTTFAGQAGTKGYKDGVGTTALFNEPRSLVVDDRTGDVYVSDTNNNVIRRISPSGVVTTLAGSGGVQGSVDGTGSVARFKEPHGIALDSSGNLYVADYMNGTIRKVTTSGVVTTLAGTAGTTGFSNGVGASASFRSLQGIAVDTSGNLYVADAGNRAIRKITSSGTVTTLAGASGNDFGQPHGLALGSGGTVLYVTDYTSNVVKQVNTTTGQVTLLAGTAPSAGSTDGTTTTALFNSPAGIAVDGSGVLFLADSGNSTLRKIATGSVTTFAGTAGRSSSVDGTGSEARFDDPYALAVDSAGNVFVADASDHTIRKVSTSGVVTTVAGKAGSFGAVDGAGTAARFRGPLGVAVDADGVVYVADTGNHTVRKITSAGVVSTLAGLAGSSGSLDGTGTAARLSSPYGVTVDNARNIYVMESTGVVRKISPDGAVTSLAGQNGSTGLVDGTGSAARFTVPFDIAADTGGRLLVSDHGNHAVRAVTATGAVTTLAGSGQPGYTNATGSAATFKFPSGIAVDAQGNVFLADTDNQVIRLITSSGQTSTVLGNNQKGSADGPSASATFSDPKDVAVDSAGNLYIADRGNRTIRKATLVTGGGTSAGLAAASSTAATLSQSTTGFVLDVPYFEYTLNGQRQAFACSFSSADLTRFTLQSSSVAGRSLQTGTGPFAQFVGMASGFQLSLPYLEFGGSGGVPKAAFSVTLATTDLSGFSVVPGSVAAVAVRSSLVAPNGVSAAASGIKTTGSYTFGSSSKLGVSWSAATGNAVDHYEVQAVDALTGVKTVQIADKLSTSAVVSGLKAATGYSVTVKACADAPCASSATSDAVSATTPEEYWQLQGTGNSVATLTQPVSDGNARLSATRFGPEAVTTANTVQFYYGPMRISGQSVATSQAVNSSNPSSYLTGFTSFASTSGLRSPTPPATSGIQNIMTGQGVPLGTAMGGPKVRLFFESNDADGKTRIYSVDSVDGYTGRDFNTGSATTCNTSADYLSTGSCPATVVIGVQGDAIRPTNKISAARQNKVGWPTLTDWRWNGEAGTFMVYTIDQVSGCTSASHNHAYAVWDGSKFVTQYESNGCPKAFKAAQAAVPMHIGGSRYKMYFGDPTVTTGKISTSTLPFVGPKKLIFADGSLTGSASMVDFEDWEATAAARNVHFLWPNGDKLSDEAEGYIDDFHFLTPTGSLDTQVLYLSITDGRVVPFAATAVLLNP